MLENPNEDLLFLISAVSGVEYKKISSMQHVCGTVQIDAFVAPEQIPF